MKIEEAISLHEEAKRKYEIERFKTLNEIKLNIIHNLDEWLKLNIHEVLKAPKLIYLKCAWPPYEIHQQIQDSYPEFTLLLSCTNERISIKLADKDWDWKGYGIKDEEHEIELKTKTSEFKRIFKKLFR